MLSGLTKPQRHVAEHGKLEVIISIDNTPSDLTSTPALNK